MQTLENLERLNESGELRHILANFTVSTQEVTLEENGSVERRGEGGVGTLKIKDLFFLFFRIIYA